jgi:hypothetical protein
MASIFTSTVTKLYRAVSDAAGKTEKPGDAPVAPVVFDAAHQVELKRLLPGSIVKMQDGSYKSGRTSSRATRRGHPIPW